MAFSGHLRGECALTVDGAEALAPPTWHTLRAEYRREPAARASPSRQYPSDQQCCAVSGNRIERSGARVCVQMTSGPI
ncbi:unnamed protein product, partial [Iphiclides podalirius]